MNCPMLSEYSLCRNNYSFRCHRQDAVPNKKDQSIVYAVNDVKFHPVYDSVFVTCGKFRT
jgi:mRNA export factor